MNPKKSGKIEEHVRHHKKRLKEINNNKVMLRKIKDGILRNKKEKPKKIKFLNNKNNKMLFKKIKAHISKNNSKRKILKNEKAK